MPLSLNSIKPPHHEQDKCRVKKYSGGGGGGIRVPLDLDSIIKFLERTNEEKWCTEVVRTQDGKGCVMSHIFDMGGNFFWEMFESLYATTYMIYPINDGENEQYKQATPKERVIAYLKDMRDGKAKSCAQIMEEFDEMRLNEREENKHIIDIQKKSPL